VIPRVQMSKPSPQHTAMAQRLIATESGTGDGGDAYASAAARVYDKLEAQLSPLLGSLGFRTLFLRSAKLTRGEFPCLADPSVVESPAKLSACVQTLDPDKAKETVEALFGTFFELITTFIGERLTTQVLRRAWPKIDESDPEEPQK
jgi:hypothetical protein